MAPGCPAALRARTTRTARSRRRGSEANLAPPAEARLEPTAARWAWPEVACPVGAEKAPLARREPTPAQPPRAINSASRTVRARTLTVQDSPRAPAKTRAASRRATLSTAIPASRAARRTARPAAAHPPAREVRRAGVATRPGRPPTPAEARRPIRAARRTARPAAAHPPAREVRRAGVATRPGLPPTPAEARRPIRAARRTAWPSAMHPPAREVRRAGVATRAGLPPTPGEARWPIRAARRTAWPSAMHPPAREVRRAGVATRPGLPPTPAEARRPIRAARRTAWPSAMHPPAREVRRAGVANSGGSAADTGGGALANQGGATDGVAVGDASASPGGPAGGGGNSAGSAADTGGGASANQGGATDGAADKSSTVLGKIAEASEKGSEEGVEHTLTTPSGWRNIYEHDVPAISTDIAQSVADKLEVYASNNSTSRTDDDKLTTTSNEFITELRQRMRDSIFARIKDYITDLGTSISYDLKNSISTYWDKILFKNKDFTDFTASPKQ